MNIGIYDAKSKLSELIDKVRAGKEVVITRHGEPVAKLVPMSPPQAADAAELVRDIRALRKRLNVRTSIPLRKLIEAGRD